MLFTRLVRTTVRKKFFQTQPLYPDAASKLNLYSFTPTLDIPLMRQRQQHNEGMRQQDKEFIYQLLTKNNYRKSKSKKAIKRSLAESRQQDMPILRLDHLPIDPDTKLPLGIGYDDLISQLKEEFVSQDNNKYVLGLLSLVKELGLKNQVQLIRLFKRALIMSRADQLEQSFKGTILKEGVQMASAYKEFLLAESRTEALKQAGDEIHEDVKKAESKIGIQPFDIYFGKKHVHQDFNNPDMESDLADNRNHFSTKGQVNLEKGARIKLLESIEQRYRQIQMYKKKVDKYSLVTKQQGALSLDILQDTQFRSKVEELANELDIFDEVVGVEELKSIQQKLDIVLECAPAHFKIMKQKDQQEENNLFSPTFFGRKLDPSRLVWGRLPIDQTLDITAPDTKHMITQENIYKLSPQIKLQTGLYSLPIQLHKHPLRDIVHYYASRNPEAGYSEDLVKLDPEERVALYRTKVDAVSDKHGYRTRYTFEGKAWGGGGCKSSSAMCYLKPSETLHCQINHMRPDEYFSQSVYRAQALTPLYIAGMQDEYQVRLFVKGGGKRAKAQACANAMARAIIKLKPELKGQLKDLGMITLDRRHKQAKKMNRYKARKSYPFVRR